MMDDDVTQWVYRLVEGDQAAAEVLWRRYFEQLVRLARRKLEASNRRAADEEDAALSAFDSFCRGAAAGRFPRLDDREDLWKVLVTITVRKAAGQVKYERRQKRAGGKVRGESVFQAAGDSEAAGGIDQVLGGEPTPELAAMMAERCGQLLGCLDEPLRQIALWKLEGASVEEIADRMNCALRTVKRRLASIRETWERQCGEILRENQVRPNPDGCER